MKKKKKNLLNASSTVNVSVMFFLTKGHQHMHLGKLPRMLQPSALLHYPVFLWAASSVQVTITLICYLCDSFLLVQAFSSNSELIDGDGINCESVKSSCSKHRCLAAPAGQNIANAMKIRPKHSTKCFEESVFLKIFWNL